MQISDHNRSLKIKQSQSCAIILRSTIESKISMRMIFGIGTGLILLFIALFITCTILSSTPIPPEIARDIAIASAVIMASLPYFLYVFPRCSRQIPAGEAEIMSNDFINESATKRRVFSGYREINAQTEFQSGFSWTYPWETPYKRINMIRVILVENDPEKTYTLKGGKKLIRIAWRVFCTPLPGSVVNFSRTEEEAIRRRINDRVEAFLQGEVGRMSHVGFGKKQMKSLKAKFEKVYGGPNKIDPEEEALGVWTGTPEIVDIDEPKDVQAARNFVEVMTSAIEAADKMVKASKGQLRFEPAMKLALVGSGKANIDYTELTLTGGLFGTHQPQHKPKPNS